MLKDKAIAATLAVSDLNRARGFYEQTLGLEPFDENPGAITYRVGPSFLLVYPSDYAGTNQATGATWAVGDDFETVVEDLRKKGVTFEQYDLPDTTREGDIHVMGDMRAAWFKDPDGNILSLTNQAM
jgi:catechol 2,3-dioxygenase-like lactoylglutathione lyase family enzyme